MTSVESSRPPRSSRVVDEMEKHAVQLRHEHLVNLVLEDVVVQFMPLATHHERRAVLDEMPRHQRVLRETAPGP